MMRNYIMCGAAIVLGISFISLGLSSIIYSENKITQLANEICKQNGATHSANFNGMQLCFKEFDKEPFMQIDRMSIRVRAAAEEIK